MSLDRFGQPIEQEPNPFIDLIDVRPQELLSAEAFNTADTRNLQATVATAALTATLIAGSTFMTKNKVSAHDGAVLDRAPAVLAVGDSLTVGQILRDYEAKLESTGLEADVFGVGGETFDYGIEILTSHPDLVDDVDVVIAALGTNYGSVDRMVDGALQFGRTADTLGSVDEHSPTIVYQGIFDRDNEVLAAEKNRRYREEIIPTLAAEGIDALFIDRSSHMQQRGIDDYISPNDGIHLSPTGYGLLNQQDIELIVPIARAALSAQQLEHIQSQAIDAPDVDTTVSPELTQTVEYFSLVPPQATIATETPTETLDIFGNSYIPETADVFSLVASDSEASSDNAIEEQPSRIDRVQVPLTEAPILIDEQVPELSSNQLDTVDQPVLSNNSEQFDNTRSIDTVKQQAAKYGIFYDENGRAQQYIKSFLNPNQVPRLIITQGWGDLRNLGNGTYGQGNVDSRVQPYSNAEFLAPIIAVAETDRTSGEGNKLTMRAGIDDETGIHFRLYTTHLSEFAVDEGTLLLPRQISAYSGQSGKTDGPHNSTGITSYETNNKEYINMQESRGQHIFDYIDPDLEFDCLPKATDDRGEICGRTTPDTLKSLTIPQEFFVAFPHIPEYLSQVDEGFSDSSVPTAESTSSPLPASDPTDIFTLEPSDSQPSDGVSDNEQPPRVSVPETVPIADETEDTDQVTIVPETIDTLPIEEPNIDEEKREEEEDQDSSNSQDNDQEVEVEDSVPESEPVESTNNADSRRDLLAQDPLAFINNPAWRQIIGGVGSRPEFADSDGRLAAALLHVEQRGEGAWNEDPYQVDAISPSNARGDFQMLPQSWFGWRKKNQNITNWGEDGNNYLNNELYNDSAFGRDGNDDGIRNPDDPVDSTAAAMYMLRGSKLQPIALEGLTCDPVVDIESAVLELGSGTQLARAAAYNGGSTPGRTPQKATLSELRQNRDGVQTPDYVRMVAGLLLTDLQFGIDRHSDNTGKGYSWIDSATLVPVTEDFVRSTIPRGTYCD